MKSAPIQKAMGEIDEHSPRIKISPLYGHKQVHKGFYF